MSWTNSFVLTVYKNRTSRHMTDEEIIHLYCGIINKVYSNLLLNIKPFIYKDAIIFSATISNQNITSIIFAIAKDTYLDYKLSISDDYQNNYDGCYTFTRMKDWKAHDDFIELMLKDK